MKTVSELDSGRDPLESETDKAVTAGFCLKDAVICSPHCTSLSDLIGPEDVSILEKVGRCPRV
jgi:hypothetical protein